MGNIRRGTISRDYVDALKLDVGNGSPAPTDASEKVVLTYDYSNARYCDIVKYRDSGGAVYTAPTDRDLYITSITVFTYSAAAGAAGYGYVSVVVGGATIRMAMVYVSPTATAASSDVVSVNFTVPIKIDRGTALTLGSSAAVTALGASITGYEVQG